MKAARKGCFFQWHPTIRSFQVSDKYTPAAMRTLVVPLLVSLPLLLSGCAGNPLTDKPDAAYDYVYYFEEAESGEWEPHFADLPAGDENKYELSFGPAALPKETGLNKESYALSGYNSSGDLSMFVSRKLDGLQANTLYALQFNVEVASNAPRNSFGVGGSPGASVYLKAGAIAYPPARKSRLRNGTPYWQVNFDKGNQAENGSDMQLLGHIGTDRSDFTYALIERSSQEPLMVTSNAAGELWLLLGFDSGFQGKTNLYLTRLRLKLIQAPALATSSSLLPEKPL